MLMKWIELNIKCYNNDERTAELRDMGIDTPDKTEYRTLLINVDHIIGFYPNTENGCFVFVVNGDELTVMEGYDELSSIIFA